MTSEEAQAIILTFMGGQYVERWPDDERMAIFFKDVFSYNDRINVCAFLFGNLRDANLVYAAIAPQLGAAPAAHDHARRWLADLASGKYDETYHYWQVLHNPDFYYLNGRLHSKRMPLCSPAARLLHAWDTECMRMRREEGRWPTLAEQHEFLQY